MSYEEAELFCVGEFDGEILDDNEEEYALLRWVERTLDYLPRDEAEQYILDHAPFVMVGYVADESLIDEDWEHDDMLPIRECGRRDIGIEEARRALEEYWAE